MARDWYGAERERLDRLDEAGSRFALRWLMAAMEAGERVGPKRLSEALGLAIGHGQVSLD